MTLQDFLIAGYERRVHGTASPPDRDEQAFVGAMESDPALLEQARAKIAEYDAVINARGREACHNTATYRDVLAAALSKVGLEKA